MPGENTIFKSWSKERLSMKIDQYFDLMKKHHSTVSLTGLALHLHCTRKNLTDYKDTDEFGPILEMAKLRCENSLEEKMIQGTPPTGIIFILKNNYGWNDKVQIDTHLTGNISLSSLFDRAAEQKVLDGRKAEVIDGEVIETPTTESIFDSKIERTTREPEGSLFGNENVTEVSNKAELPSELF